VQEEDGVFAGSEGTVFYRTWTPDNGVERIVIIVHGYAEHSGRYQHVATALAADGQFSRAAAAAREALALLESPPAPLEAREAVRARLALFESGRPYSPPP